MSDQLWYYSQHGERKGPVSLEVLQGALAHGKIDVTTDLVWGPGLADWVKVDQVPELQNLTSVDTTSPPSSAPPEGDSSMSNIVPPSTVVKARSAENPYASPDSENALQDAMNERNAGNYPGMGRLAFFLWNCVLSVGVIAGAIFLLMVVGGFSAESGVEGLNEAMAGGMLIGLFALIVVSVVLSLLIALSRLKNLAMSRWNYLWSFVPIANIWLSYRLIGCPAGYHQHKQLDGAGKVIKVLFVLYIVLSFIAPILLSGSSYYKQAADEAASEIEAEQSSESVGE